MKLTILISILAIVASGCSILRINKTKPRTTWDMEQMEFTHKINTYAQITIDSLTYNNTEIYKEDSLYKIITHRQEDGITQLVHIIKSKNKLYNWNMFGEDNKCDFFDAYRWENDSSTMFLFGPARCRGIPLNYISTVIIGRSLEMEALCSKLNSMLEAKLH